MRQFIFACFFATITTSFINAQDYSYYAYKENKENYSQTLAELLDAARADLGIVVEVDANAQKYLSEKIPTAPWKYWSDPNLRLAYLLAPLDLTFEKKEDGSYRVFEPWYQNRPEVEGAANLERLLRRYPDKESWETRKVEIRAAMLDAFRLNPPLAATPLNPILTEEKSYDGYSTQDVALEVIPHYWLCGTLYRPTSGDGPFPLVATPHGHGKAGRLGDDVQYRGATLARMGAVVFAYGMFAWIPQDSPLTLEAHRNPISGTMQLVGSKRVVDYLTSLENVDATRIAITGESGGGTQTFFAAALDERITVAVPVVMVSSHFFGGCPCESGTPLHSRAGGISNVEIAALAAPRPQLLVAVTQDWTKNTPDVEYPFIKKIYKYYDADDSVEYAIFDEPHDYGPSKRQATYSFLAKQFNLDLTQVDESKVTIEAPEEMLPFGANLEKYPKDAVQTLDELLRAFEECPRETK